MVVFFYFFYFYFYYKFFFCFISVDYCGNVVVCVIVKVDGWSSIVDGSFNDILVDLEIILVYY